MSEIAARPHSAFLSWWNRSLLLNWMLIPVATGLFTASLNISGSAGVSDVARAARAEEFIGTVKHVGYRKRLLQVTHETGHRRIIGCGPNIAATECLPIAKLDTLRQPLTVGFFTFKREPIMLSVADADGRTIVRRADREKRLAGINAVARGESWSSSSYLAYFTASSSRQCATSSSSVEPA